MRVETRHNLPVLCGAILPAEKIEVGQVWMNSNGGLVTIEEVDQFGVVRYSWQGGMNEKDSFSFQCRYSLVLNGPEIPEELLP